MSSDHSKVEYLKPEILKSLGNLELIAKEIVAGQKVGAHRSNLKGFSSEFSHHRPYAPGDPIRDLDWRVFARTEKYYTKLYEAETNFECQVLLDASSSMNYASGEVSKLEYSKYLAASICYLILNQQDTVGLSVFDSRLRAHVPPKSTMGILVEIEKSLREIDSLPKDSLSKQLHDTALQLKRRSFVILISDLFSDVDDLMSGLDHLKHDGHNVIVLQTLDPYELDFPFKGTWRFEGLESEEELITQPDRIRTDYLKNLDEHLTQVRDRCVRSNVDYLQLNTSHSLGLALSRFLQSRTMERMGPTSGISS
jgi:uncharacterized protein (DUF58 family)